uniref:protein ANTAGONIST OF LIKE HETEROCHROMATIN PROTEIN 1-like n=1 Tax=Styela clava TaxID=7725 RepID=UPI001939DAB0|nr:protein ANTAGONIST OF LIKE HETEROCHROMATIN PROTEIN 1-like [Styela clava]
MALSKHQKLGLLLWLKRRKDKKNRCKRRRWWVHPILQRRETRGEYHRLLKEMRLERRSYFETYLRMSVEDFQILITLVGPVISKQATAFRKPIPPEERIAVTLRFLATGDSYRTIANSYRLGISTVSNIVSETCSAIWDALRGDFLKCPSSCSEWTEVADVFHKKWQFPNCLGAIDGKHVVVKCPSNAGSLYYNYKKTHSIVLLAIVDACYKFLAVDIGAYGRASDGGIFANSCFGRRLQNGTLSLPSPRPLPVTNGPTVPFVFIGDEAFPLKENLMRPFPGNGLSQEKRIFNYRLSRARRMVESTFGILANQWRVYHRPIPLKPSNIDSVIKATCCLHNFLRRDVAGAAPVDDNITVSTQLLHDIPGSGGRATQSAQSVRNTFANYFAGEGAVPWQWHHC